MKIKSITQRNLAILLSLIMFLSSFNIIDVSSLQDNISSLAYTANSDGRVFGSQWEFDVYYMNQNDKYYVEKNDDFNLKYQMEFHSSRDLKANSVEIRIPATLLTYRDGTAMLPTEIALPQGAPKNYVESSVTAFNYYIDDESGELVFFNYKEISSGSNMVWQVLYKNLDAIKIKDETSWSLEPAVSVSIDDDTTEKETAKALEGLVDTSVTLQSVSKEALKIAGKSYGPELYTEKQVKQYISGELPSWCSGENFDDYTYIVWDIKATGNGNQPWSMTLEDISTKGYVVGCKNTSGNKYNVPAKSSINTSQDSNYNKQIVENSSSENFGVRLYVVSAYPKDYATEGTVLKNNVYITLSPIDKTDSEQEKSAVAEWSYSDYDWIYRGDTIGINKSGDGIQKGALTVYKEATKSEEDKIKLTYNSVSECYGYSYTHYTDGDNLGEYINGTSYTVSTFDDVLYAYTSGSNKEDMKMLGSSDYYFTKAVITQTDKGYDVWEDVYAAPENATDIDQSVTIYAMYEDSDKWEEAAIVPWSDNGIMTYTFTAEQLARKPWRVRADHTSINYLTTCTIDVEVCLKHTSQIIKDIIDSNPGIEELTIQNLSGVTGKCNGYFHDSGAANYQQYPVELQDVSNSLYNTLPMRDNADTKITELTAQAASYKTSKSSNDATNGRVNVEYTITAYDGYDIQSKEYADYLSGKVKSPGRKEVEFYDLLPYGVKFDPSKPVTAGRITNLGSNYKTQYKVWDGSQVTVTVDTKDNYKGTGRTMVVFKVSYGGENSSTYSNNLWFEGWGVNFSTYYEWKDIEIVQEDSNISAFMPAKEDTEPLLGSEDVSKDNGSKGGIYEDFGSDINEDNETEILNVLYANNSAWEEVVTAASSKIEKLVKADSDTFGVFKQETAVEYGSGYTYEITLNNAVGELKDIVIYDKLENARIGRGPYDTLKVFDDTSWYGTFNSVVTKGLEQLGIQPVIYYSANRDAPITTGTQQSSEVLTEKNGWYKAEKWSQPLSEVKAIAVDISKKINDENFILEEGKSVSFQIKMTAPDANDGQLENNTKYAYNNTAYYSYNEENNDIGINANSTVISNSTRVSLSEKETLEVEKNLMVKFPSS